MLRTRIQNDESVRGCWQRLLSALLLWSGAAGTDRCSPLTGTASVVRAAGLAWPQSCFPPSISGRVLGSTGVRLTPYFSDLWKRGEGSLWVQKQRLTPVLLIRIVTITC